MSDEAHFEVNQIVWASAHQYTSWPARIARKLYHNGKIVYKVNFLTQPTYCYLYSHSLSPFSDQAFSTPKTQDQNLKFQREFLLAKASISKQFDKNAKTNGLCLLKIQAPANQPVPFKYTLIQSKEEIDLPQKTQQYEQPQLSQVSFNDLSFNQVSPSNVLETLDKYLKGHMAQQLTNLKRKQIICFQNHLKQNLLLKYKLQAVDFFKLAQKSSSTTSNHTKYFKNHQKIKKNNLSPQFNTKQIAIRKIQKILFQKGMNRKSSSKVTLKIINQLQKYSEASIKKGPNSFEGNAVKIIQQISQNLPQIGEMEEEYIEKHVLSFIDLEQSHGKLSEGSRMTQMHQTYA